MTLSLVAAGGIVCQTLMRTVVPPTRRLALPTATAVANGKLTNYVINTALERHVKWQLSLCQSEVSAALAADAKGAILASPADELSSLSSPQV